MIRDRLSNPQPGDQLISGTGEMRKVIRRDGDMIECQVGGICCKITVKRWIAWCEKNDAMPIMAED